MCQLQERGIFGAPKDLRRFSEAVGKYSHVSLGVSEILRVGGVAGSRLSDAERGLRLRRRRCGCPEPIRGHVISKMA